MTDRMSENAKKNVGGVGYWGYILLFWFSDTFRSVARFLVIGESGEASPI